MAADWVAQYIGAPWRAHGRGPDVYDCWGLIAAVLGAVFGVRVPSYTEQYSLPAQKDGGDKRGDQQHRGEEWAHIAGLIDRERGTWISVAPGMEVAGDVILLRMRGQPIHVGIVVAPGEMLHTLEGLGACVERYREAKWRHRVQGCYRAPEMIVV